MTQQPSSSKNLPNTLKVDSLDKDIQNFASLQNFKKIASSCKNSKENLDLNKLYKEFVNPLINK